MCGTCDTLDKPTKKRKIVAGRKHISVHLVCWGAVLNRLRFWLSCATIGLFIAISGTLAHAAPEAEHRNRTPQHRRDAKPRRNPAHNAKSTPKKKRPTVPHNRRRTAKQPEAAARSRHRHHGARPPQSGRTLESSRAQNLGPKPIAHTPDTDQAGRLGPKSARVEPSWTKSPTAPVPPKQPEAPTVQQPEDHDRVKPEQP